jgi:putative endonuclease
MKDGLSRYLTGLAAEEIAERHYNNLFGRILARRVRTPAGEIDLIVAWGETTVFVEVKSRKTLHDAAGALSVAQSERIMRAAEFWMAESGWCGDIRFDVALTDRQGRLEVIENALI